MKSRWMAIAAVFSMLTVRADERPNILWIYAEDTSPWMGCYGHSINEGATPNIDSIANAGVKFTRAFVPAPVCSATRSALMAGQSGIRIGAHEHRSSRGEWKIELPEGVCLLPELMREQGYTTFNNGKTDYNYVWDAAIYSHESRSKTDFSALVDQQPFFGQIQTKGGKNNTTKFPAARKVDPASVTVPADYPDNEIYRGVVAQHYDAIRKDDDLIGGILRGLEKAGLLENTIVVYFSDHGANHLVRHKQMTTEGGLHVPFVVMGPEAYVPKKRVRDDLVNLLDLSATTLAWAGAEIPRNYEGRDLFAADFKPRTFVGAHKDRLDHTIDRVRSIRTDRFRYVRNFKTDRILLQPQYRDNKEYTRNLRDLYQEGALPEPLKSIYFGERPEEELYEVLVDPAMVRNLANDPAFADELERHRSLLSAWLSKGDLGAEEEPIEELQLNGEGQKWGEGVNVEYEAYRADSDGDGLSDKWEELNGRDPADGLLRYAFDCGGWQTEGWTSEHIAENLAGFQGFLEFKLDGAVGSISRKGLSVSAAKNGRLALRARADGDLAVSVFANGKLAGEGGIKASDAFAETVLLINAADETFESLELVFNGAAGTNIEIDSIQAGGTK